MHFHFHCSKHSHMKYSVCIIKNMWAQIQPYVRFNVHQNELLKVMFLFKCRMFSSVFISEIILWLMDFGYCHSITQSNEIKLSGIKSKSFHFIIQWYLEQFVIVIEPFPIYNYYYYPIIMHWNYPSIVPVRQFQVDTYILMDIILDSWL